MDDTIHRSYEGFAYVYDTFMDNVPYEEWAEYVTGILEEYGITDGLVLDLGCGTGSMTELLAEKGYDMISPRICWRLPWTKEAAKVWTSSIYSRI